jgi:hypothetical protein
MAEGSVADIKSRGIQAPTEETGGHRPLVVGQTVCTIKDAKGNICAGHVKQWFTAPPEVLAKAAPDNTIHRCQRCFAVYEGPPQEYLHPQVLR